jgi:hypothetical protein
MTLAYGSGNGQPQGSGSGYRADSRDTMPAPVAIIRLWRQVTSLLSYLSAGAGFIKWHSSKMPWRSAGSDGERLEPS